MPTTLQECTSDVILSGVVGTRICGVGAIRVTSNYIRQRNPTDFDSLLRQRDRPIRLLDFELYLDLLYFRIKADLVRLHPAHILRFKPSKHMVHVVR